MSTKTKKEPQGYVCHWCGTTYTNKNTFFYSSKHEMYKHNGWRTTVCRDCVHNIFDGYVHQYGDRSFAFYQTCAKFGWYFSENAFRRVDNGQSTAVGLYMQKANTGECKGKTFEDNIYERFHSPIGNAGDTVNSDIREYSDEWAGEYTPKEIEYLDAYYAGLLRDYKIITENHRDYARKISKASLYMDQCLEAAKTGDKNATGQYKQAQEIFDKLCQSAKFAESTRSINDVGLGCFGRIVEEVEKGEYVYKHIPIAKDDIDEILTAFSTIEKSL